MDTVVIASDGSGANVDPFPDLSVAEISEMVGLGTFAHLDFLGLDEISNVRTLANIAAWTEPRIRPDDRATGDAGIVHDGERVDGNAVSEFRVLDDAIGPDAAIGADFGLAQQLHERLDDRIGANLDVTVDHARLRIENSHSFGHQLLAFCQAQAGVQVNNLSASITAEDFASIGRFDGHDFLARSIKHRRHVREVVLMVRVSRGEFSNVLIEVRYRKDVEAGIDLANFLLCDAGGFFFDDAANLHTTSTFAQYAAIAGRIGKIGAKKRHGRMPSSVGGA